MFDLTLTFNKSVIPRKFYAIANIKLMNKTNKEFRQPNKTF